MRAVTGGEEADEEAEEPTPEKHVRKVIGIDKANRYGDKRPTLVYFHWPHEDGKEGKVSEKTCKILDDEEAARWSLLFRCVQVDMGTSETEFAQLIGAKDAPSFVLLDKDAKVVTAFPAFKSARKVSQALEKGLKKFPAYNKKVKADLKQQCDWLAEAKKLQKAKKNKEALALIDKVRFSNLRVGDHYDKSHDTGRALAAKIDREQN